MTGGYIKLWRELRDDALWQKMTPSQRGSWVSLLLEVNWRETEFGCRVCGKTICVPAGGTCKSSSVLAQAAGVSRRAHQRLMQKLVQHGFILNQSRARCHTLYVVKNWDKYQVAAVAPAPDLTLDGCLGGSPGAAQLRRREEVKKRTLSVENPDPALQTAEHHRQLILGYGGRETTGIQVERAWSKKRGLWAQTYRAIAIRPGIPCPRQRELLTWAFEDDSKWGDGVMWRDVLSGSSPPQAWERNCRKIQKKADWERAAVRKGRDASFASPPREHNPFRLWKAANRGELVAAGWNDDTGEPPPNYRGPQPVYEDPEDARRFG